VTPDLRLVSIGVNPDGSSWMRFATMGRSAHPVREVVLTVKASSKLMYEYSIYDGTLKTINQYRGEHGDPEQDEWLGSYGLQPPTIR
jgi:hypothetical protein